MSGMGADEEGYSNTRVDGDPLLGQLVAAEIPIVACGRVLGYEHAISSVSADDRGGARSAVEHLLQTGCRRIATITGPVSNPVWCSGSSASNAAVG